MRTKNQDGVIVSIGDNAGKPALAVEMYQGQVGCILSVLL